MSTSQFVIGSWTYRSFLNDPAIVDDFNKLRFGQGQMTFEAAPLGSLRGEIAFRSDPPQPEDPRLTLSGSIQLGSPFAVRFQGVGVKGTQAEGWVYDYVGYLIPKWPDGKDQRPALVGSVIRTVPHNGRPSGVVASFIAVQRDFVEPRDVIPLPETVLKAVASRHHRLHHMVWHSTRNMWSTISEEQRTAVDRLGWRPPRPSLDRGTVLVRNGSGEDFLFMHRQMIAEVNRLTQQAGAPPITGWGSPPPPASQALNSNGFMAPPAWIDPVDEGFNRRIAALKTDEYFWSRMRWWDREFKNPQYLSTLTLGELGALIEYSIHNDMHMRWASIPRDPETQAELPAGRPSWDISPKWDTPVYDHLGEFYSSHVNPVFWRLHGWVDDRITDWFAAHEAVHPGAIERAAVGGVPWFKPGQWVQAADPWSGPTHHHSHGSSGSHGSESPHFDIDKMEKVIAILFPPPTAPEATAARAAAAVPTPLEAVLSPTREALARATRF